MPQEAGSAGQSSAHPARTRLAQGVAWACVIALGFALGWTGHPTGALKVVAFAVGVVNAGLFIAFVVSGVSRIRKVGLAEAISAAKTWVLVAAIIAAGLLIGALLGRA
jgi:hypothetical protein